MGAVLWGSCFVVESLIRHLDVTFLKKLMSGANPSQIETNSDVSDRPQNAACFSTRLAKVV